MRAILALSILLSLGASAGGQGQLVSGLSQDSIEITSNYTGTDLVIFGAIERPHLDEINDIVVVVRGPAAAITVRRKDRIMGLWLNNASAKFSGIASYYFLAATRPLAEIAAPEILNRYGLGLDSLTAKRVVSDGAASPYRAALVRALKRRDMYAENPAGVTMLSPTLFRVHVPLPAAAPRGQYMVQTYLIRQGQIASAQSTPLFVDQTGFERKLHAFAHRKPWLYGFVTVLIAVACGWLSSLIFRRRG